MIHVGGKATNVSETAQADVETRSMDVVIVGVNIWVNSDAQHKIYHVK